MGVTIKKKIIPIIIGEIILLSNKPNLCQRLFNGFKILEFNKPSIKKTKLTNKDHSLIFSSFNKGYNAIKIKTIKKTIPKLLLELILVFFIILII